MSHGVQATMTRTRMSAGQHEGGRDKDIMGYELQRIRRRERVRPVNRDTLPKLSRLLASEKLLVPLTNYIEATERFKLPEEQSW
jgi:hypothetical protein